MPTSARHITPLRAALAGTVVLALLVPLILHLCAWEGAQLTAGGCCQASHQDTAAAPCHETAADADSSGTLACCASAEAGIVDEAILTLRESSAQLAELAGNYVVSHVVEPAVEFVRDLASRLIPSAAPRGSTQSLHLLNAVFLN